MSVSTVRANGVTPQRVPDESEVTPQLDPAVADVVNQDAELRALAEIEAILAGLSDSTAESYRSQRQRVVWYMAERYGLVGKPKYPGARGGRAR